MNIKENLTINIKIFLIMTIILGVIYPFSIWLIGQIFTNHTANGSLIYRNGIAIGSKLIAQEFTKEEFFHPRPKQHKILSPKSKEALEMEIKPSASNLDPHISTKNALNQAIRVSRARNIPLKDIEQLIHNLTEYSFSLTNKYVNVLSLNLQLIDMNEK